MVELVDDRHKQLASRLRDILSTYNQNADLVSIGAYKSGTNPKLDFALTKIDRINEFLKQGVNEAFTYEQCLEQMEKILAGR
jgi:flagellum-specific ATP synthase